MPTTTNLKAIIRINLIKDCKVNTEDVNLAERVYSPNIGSLKGKSARAKPASMTSNMIELPEELLNIQENITLSIDGMQVSGLKILMTIFYDVYYRTAQVLEKNPNFEICKIKLKEIELLYRESGYRVNEIHTDLEYKKILRKFCRLYNPVIKSNFILAGKHVPCVERNHRIIKE